MKERLIMKVNSFSLKMNDGCEIFLNRWEPDAPEDIKGVVQLHHGLAEHSMRYDRLGSILAENGYVLNAYDMRGHGKTAETAIAKGEGRFGQLARKNGFETAVEDLAFIIESLKKDYPDKKIVLLGHSFGSFISQGYIEKYGERIDGCILCGTSGPQIPLAPIGKVVAKVVRAFKGPDATSKFLTKLSFGSYNKHIANPQTADDWISLNELNRQMYEMDKWCGFPLTVSFFVDITTALSTIHKKKNMKTVPTNLPVFFIYGKEDPVGGYGKTIEKLYEIYQKNGVKNLQIKGYENDRHEIFNEDDKETVEKDVLQWLSGVLK